MIRFRNPVSDMDILIENFRKMYIEFSDMDYFDLDNIAEFLAREKLASSSGYIGDEALKRSYQIKDDSRNSMKMQSKSYSELFRVLGWIDSGDKALHFNFTYLGLHIALSGIGAKFLFEQCLLGIEYPNHVIDVKFSDINKPFLNMLLLASDLSGRIHRDEILLSALDMSDGYSQNERQEKIKHIKRIRKTKQISVLERETEKLAEKNSMAVDSVRNITRFVISSLQYVGWFEEKRLKDYGTSRKFYVLTDKGKRVAESVRKSLWLKGSSIDTSEESSKRIAELALLRMFKRANFNVDKELEQYKNEMDKICEEYKDIIFSPYQYFSGEELSQIFPQNILQQGSEHRSIEIDINLNILTTKSQVLVKATKTETSENEQTKKMLIKRLKKSNQKIDNAVELFMQEIVVMKHKKFYPLVANLLGFIFNRKAFAPSAGNNNLRYDVIIPDDNYSIPVEVKSPTEEEMLSVKAIRQATENKVLMLARKPYSTTFEVSTFACGFKLPNDRSDVYKLIEEIYEIYKINIAILDMKTLIKTAFYCVQSETYFDVAKFVGKRGVINFENI